MSKITIYTLSLNFGGAERVICNIANMLSDDNEVVIKSIYKKNEGSFYKLDDNIKIEYLTNLYPNRDALKEAISKKNILKIFKEILRSIYILYNKKKSIINSIKNDGSDIIITTRKEHNYYLSKYAKDGIIKVGQEHNDFSNPSDIKKVIKGAKNLDYFLPASKFLTDKYKELLKNYPVKVNYIPHSIEKYKIKNLEKKEQIICVGRLEPVKAFEDAISAFKGISNKNVNLIIAGDGSQEGYLKSLVGDYKDRICFVGRKSIEELYKLYEESYFLLSTSKSESFGLVALEAANAGIPTVAFDSAEGLKEIIDNNKTGIIIKNRDIHSMSKTIDNLLNDKNTISKLGNAAKTKSEVYCEKNVKNIWKEFVKSVK